MGTKEKSNKGARRKQYSAPALEKGLDILELLADEPIGLTSSAIARRLDRSMGELFRMLVVLEQRGYVAAPPDSERYSLTLRLFELSHKFPPVKRLITAAGPVMRQLSRDIVQSCHLSIYYEGKGHVVVQEDSSAARVVSVKLGAEIPLFENCSGHVLLAFSNDDERNEMVVKAQELGKVPGKAARNKLVSEIRKRGFEIVDSSVIHGIRDIGFPVFDHMGRVAAALAVPFLTYLDGSHPVKIELATSRIEAAAQVISNALGNTG